MIQLSNSTNLHLDSKAVAADQKRGALLSLVLTAMLLLLGLLSVTGCQSTLSQSDLKMLGDQLSTNRSELIILREGDTIRIEFPGNANLSTASALILRDGTINLPFVGEVQAAGKTPDQLKAELQKLYASQVETKELLVQVLSSRFPVYVVGAVVRPGKIESDHPITILEALMEDGGPDLKTANLKTVIVLRQDGKRLKSFTVNIKEVLKGHDHEQFYMKPFDIIFVKERFTWF